MTGASPEYSHLYDEIDELKSINADLLAALENAINMFDLEDMAHRAAYEQARAAIAKARNS